MSVNIKENDALNGIAKLIPASNITLSSLPDTNITLPQAEQSLGYDEASGRWINYNVRISVYYSNDFRGLNISCTKGQTTITKTAPMDGNAVVFYVNEKGTWTVSANIGATEYTDTVVVTSFGVTYPAQLVTSSSQTPEGATVEPTDDIQIWLACANLDKPYTTLDAVLADRETFETLIADSNACDYMARSTTWASDTTDDADAMALIGRYDYCSNALLSNATWASAIANSDYISEILPISVPTMTSDTTPSGECICSGYATNQEAYKAFDNNDSTTWSHSNATYAGAYVGYKFSSSVKVDKIVFTKRNLSGYGTGACTAKIQGSNDNSTWVDLTSTLSFEQINTSIAGDTIAWNITQNSGKYLYYRLYYLTYEGQAVAGGLNPTTAGIQFYGRASAQTNIIHSAPNDTIYYMEDGSPVIVATTNSDGDGILDFSSLEDKEYTFYSSVAKDPSNLSNDFSKTIRITKSEYGGTTEMYLLPDTVKTLYWYGYMSNDCETLTTANGWTSYIDGTVTFNTNDASLASNAGIGTKKSTSFTKVHTICKSTAVSGGIGVTLRTNSVKNGNSSNYVYQSVTNTIQHLEIAPSSGHIYAYVNSVDGRTGSVYALWYE